ncbi:glycosyltransferase [Pseudodesulfovibrio cashew]|uniref:Glycosyltransferase n=1 Tax=Pseudodesulfovibrio cashew TaxID=2678688 RepID=A0A6I6JF64_9BACT|nr:glycosyltransferase [Pseudodesulfovibrio cashew]QGY39173.1 glycosyltransferase [Pseudodesulfovibrio cashew]
MNVLVIDEDFPHPTNTGKRLRTYNLLSRLQASHTIHYVFHGNQVELPGCPNIRCHPIDKAFTPKRGLRFYAELLGNLVSSKPYIVSRHYSEPMMGKVNDILHENEIDLIHCEWTPYTENIRSLLGVYPTILSTHNVESQIWGRYFENEGNLLKKAYIYLQWKKMAAYEKDVAGRYDHVVCVSDNDAEFFSRHAPAGRVSVVPNGVDEVYFSPRGGKQKQGNLVFTGSMDWRPNQDAVSYFVEEIFPLIRERNPEAQFYVVGRYPPEGLKAQWEQTEGVTVTGIVDDVRGYIEDAAVYIVPLRIGGGSRLKILEALSMEKVVVSTRVGAEGLALEDHIHLLLRDDPALFASCVTDILASGKEYAGIAREGRQQVLETYTWDSISTVLDAAWHKAARSRRGA